MSSTVSSETRRALALVALSLVLGCAERPRDRFEIELPPDAVNVPQGGTAELSVHLVRLDGFAGEVHIRVESLPAGVTSTEGVVSAGSTDCTLTLSTPPWIAVPRPVLVQVRGDSAHGTKDAPLVLTVRGVPGALDTSFGDGGIRSIGEGIRDTAVLPDGRLLVTASSSVCRLRVDGSLDDAFGEGGCATVFADPSAWGTNILLDPSGFFLLASVDFQIAIARFHFDGTLDPSFGTGGVVLHGAAGTYELPTGAVLSPDGIAILAYLNGPTGQEELLLRFNLDGSPTATFGTNGRVDLAEHRGAGLARRPNGGFVVGGDSLLFLTPEGDRDPKFPDGIVETPESVRVFTFHGDKLFAAGTTHVYRYSSDGKPEDVYTQPGDWAVLTGLSFDEKDEMLLFGGSGTNPYFPHFLLGRRTPSGAWDESFSPGGVHSYLAGPFARSVHVLPDGRYLLTGTNRTPDNIYSGVLLRVWD